MSALGCRLTLECTWMQVNSPEHILSVLSPFGQLQLLFIKE